MIQESKRLRFELEQLKAKVGCQEDPVFKGTIANTIIDLDAEDETNGEKDKEILLSSSKVAPTNNPPAVDDEKLKSFE